MQRFLLGLGVVASVVLLGVSMAMNWRFGFGFGRTELDGHIFGVASAAADVLKALLPLFGLWAYRQKRWTGVAVSLLVWVICTVYSMTSALGFAALNRADVVSERRVVAERYLSMKTEVVRLQNRLAVLPDHRPLVAVEEVLAAHRQRRRWSATRKCTSVTVDKSRIYCAEHFKLRSELAVTREAGDLEKRLVVKVRKLAETNRSVESIGQADPQAAILSVLFGHSSEEVQTAMVLLLALFTEVGSGLELFVSIGHSRVKGVEVGDSGVNVEGGDLWEQFFSEVTLVSFRQVHVADCYQRFSYEIVALSFIAQNRKGDRLAALKKGFKRLNRV